NLENQTIEHSRHRSELDTINTYHTETSEVGRIVRKCEKEFAQIAVCTDYLVNCGLQGNDCGSSVVTIGLRFTQTTLWIAVCKGMTALNKDKINLIIPFFLFNKDDKNSRTIKLFWNKQDIAIESEIIDEEAQLQWRKGNLEFERTGLNYLQATSSAVQEKQISSYTSYKQSTSKFATSTKKKSTRKRKSVSYTESSEEEDHSSDQDYTEKPKRKQESRRSKRLRGKANCDDMDKGDITVETLEDENTSSPAQPTMVSNTSEDTTLCEITPSTPQQLNTSEDFATSRETTYDEFSAHIICAFNTTIHLVKETIKEPTMYERVRNMLQSRNKLAMSDSIIKKLENIFQANYSEIESKIISETNIGDNQTSEEDRFMFFIRCALLDFVFRFRYLMPKVLDRDMLERSYIVECLSPILRAFRNAFPDVKYMWLEKDELLNVEVSGPPYRLTKKHTVGDVKKLLIMAICSLCRLLGNSLDCNIEDAKNVKTYSIQVIGDRLTLFAVSLVEKRKYLAVELASCVTPFAFDAITCYMKIFNFFSVIRSEFVEQEKLQKKIRSFIPTDKFSENVREWLHLPDDDISLVTEEDMDEIFMM
ncbi:12410_t:CDS:2, partial [Funneliformis caledonium]